jgi:hypothetical protein
MSMIDTSLVRVAFFYIAGGIECYGISGDEQIHCQPQSLKVRCSVRR